MDAFARVLAEPGSAAARRALLAEWKTKGDARADILQQQLDLILLERNNDESADALKRAIRVAVAKNGKQWAGELAGLVTKFVFRRGLVAEITISGADFVARAQRLFELAPIQHVTITAPLPSVTALFDLPQLAKLSTLNIPGLGAQFGDAGAIALAGCRHATNLKWISLTKDAVTLVGAESLAASTLLAGVHYLGLEGNPADPTPFAQEMQEGQWTAGRPALAAQLEAKFGSRPWLQTPNNPEAWPPDHDALAIT
jgi:hypothetical protein